MPNEKLTYAVQMMIRTNKMHKAMIDSRVKEIGIHRTQHIILMSLARHEKIPSQKELAEKLDITPAAVTGALKSIEECGYIKRTLGQDSRYNEIEITEKGRALVLLTQTMFSEADTQAFFGVSDDELEAFVKTLEKIQFNIKCQLGCTVNPRGKEDLAK